MTTESDWQYGAYFKLYGREGLQVSFAINANDLDQHVALLGDALTRLLDGEGYSITPEGIEPGEKIQEVDGWLLSETSDGEPCVHLYKSPLQWKVATVYVEKIPDLPFKVNFADKRWLGAAPEREAAEKRGMLARCNLSIVLVPTGRTSEKGNMIMKFDRVFGQPSSSASAGTASPSEKKAEEVDSYAGLVSLLKGEHKKFAAWCRDKQETKTQKADPKQVSILCEEIDNITGESGSGEVVLEVLSGVPAYEVRRGISNYMMLGLLKWISPYVQQGKDTVKNPNYKHEYVEIIKYIWNMAFGFSEVQGKLDDPVAPSTSNVPGSMLDEDIPF